MDLCEFKVSLVYRASARTGSKATQRNPDSKKKPQNYFLYFMFMCVYACVCGLCVVPLEARRGPQISWVCA